MIVDISIAHEKQGGAVWCVSVRMVVGVGAGSDILVFGGLLGWWAVWDTDDWVMWVWACGCEMVKKTTQMLLEYYDAAWGYMILMHDGGYKSWWGQRILLLLGTSTTAATCYMLHLHDATTACYACWWWMMHEDGATWRSAIVILVLLVCEGLLMVMVMVVVVQLLLLVLLLYSNTNPDHGLVVGWRTKD